MSPTKKHLRKDDPPKTTPHIPVQYLFVNDHRSREFLRLLRRYMTFTRTPRKPSKSDNAILHELPSFKAHGKPAPSSSLTHEADGQHHSAIENALVVDAPSSGCSEGSNEESKLRKRIAELESIIREMKNSPSPRWTRSEDADTGSDVGSRSPVVSTNSTPKLLSTDPPSSAAITQSLTHVCSPEPSISTVASPITLFSTSHHSDRTPLTLSPSVPYDSEASVSLGYPYHHFNTQWEWAQNENLNITPCADTAESISTINMVPAADQFATRLRHHHRISGDVESYNTQLNSYPYSRPPELQVSADSHHQLFATRSIRSYAPQSDLYRYDRMYPRSTEWKLNNIYIRVRGLEDSTTGSLSYFYSSCIPSDTPLPSSPAPSSALSFDAVMLDLFGQPNDTGLGATFNPYCFAHRDLTMS
ncbi:hypothetical protein PHLCEN_2v8954 [Hermanssonia centrifuga]|uniref:Uncharacterized protein n=1 Tax=Hermanssonia centrifuga TaxID=98765 RepID=A0A2R6NS21_9APHY|nr:hypothetical protein PHLCEN_2v8954 [Hermanssonia centrifuga]